MDANAVPDRSFGSKGRVLVVDDEPNILELIRRKLEAHRFDVVTASSGEQALECARSHTLSLILLDVALPVMDGFEILRRLRTQRDTSRIPVVMVSGQGDTNAILRSQDMKALDYLIKPIDLETLIETVERCANKAV